MLKKLKVNDLMTKDVITTSKEEEVVFAFELLMKEKISALPVVEGDKLLGIVSATDLGHNLILDQYKLGTLVESVMVKNVKSITPEATVHDAIIAMTQNIPDNNIFNQLPVVEDGKLVGIITDGDIIKAIGDKIK
jgi:CBS domain-containing protein